MTPKNYYDIYKDPLFIPVKYYENASINSDYKKNTYMLFSRKTINIRGIENQQIYCFRISSDGQFWAEPLPVFDAMRIVKTDFHVIIRGIFEIELDSRRREMFSEFGKK